MGLMEDVNKKRKEILEKVNKQRQANGLKPAQAPAKAPAPAKAATGTNFDAKKAAEDRLKKSEEARAAALAKRGAKAQPAASKPIVAKGSGKARGVVNQPKNWSKK